MVGGVEVLLQALQEGGAQRLRDVERRWPAVLEWIEDGYLKVVHGVLGPVVVPDRLGWMVLGRPARTSLGSQRATEQIALREAVVLALRRGYTVLDVGVRYLEVRNALGRRCLLYVRVAGGPPSGAAVALLMKTHRISLRREQGSLILVVLDAKMYARQQRYHPRLMVWSLEDQ